MQNEIEAYTVIATPVAQRMLINHARFLAAVSEEAAEKLIDEFEKKEISLQTFPHRGSWLSDPHLPQRKYRKLVLQEHYLLIYQIKGKLAYIHAVLDCRQNFDWLII